MTTILVMMTFISWFSDFDFHYQCHGIYEYYALRLWDCHKYVAILGIKWCNFNSVKFIPYLFCLVYFAALSLVLKRKFTMVIIISELSSGIAIE